MRSYRHLIAGVAAVGLMIAADPLVAADTSALARSASTMSACADIMEKIVAERVPRGHAQYRLHHKSHETTKDPDHRTPSDAAHEKFARFIESKVQELDDCGKKHLTEIREAWRAIRALQASGPPKGGPTDPSIAAVHKFQAESEKLADALVKLTYDKQVESYLAKPLLEHFIQNPE